MPAVKIFGRLDIEQIGLFLDGQEFKGRGPNGGI
jgi:hypothetical protein